MFGSFDSLTVQYRHYSTLGQNIQCCLIIVLDKIILSNVLSVGIPVSTIIFLFPSLIRVIDAGSRNWPFSTSSAFPSRKTAICGPKFSFSVDVDNDRSSSRPVAVKVFTVDVGESNSDADDDNDSVVFSIWSSSVWSTVVVISVDVICCSNSSNSWARNAKEIF